MTAETTIAHGHGGPRAGAATHRPPTYRGDIDGLRAIAVMSVILFHLAPSRFPAGGLGVDVFFVISGYLVGGALLREAAVGAIDWRGFYLRRVRRIAPAFLAMLIAATAAAWIHLYPDELTAFAGSALAALACGSNFWFAAHSGYFDPHSELLPLLHSWTLGVEEQFYFLFPPIVLVVARLAGGPRGRVAWLGALALASLALSQHQIRSDGPAAFYLLPSRGWELLAGVLAERVPPRLFPAGWRRFAAGAAGLALVLGSFRLVEPATGFPGLAAVPVCLGTALLIASGRAGAGPVHRLLAIAPMRLVGLASYSLYLWHWPIIVFYKYQTLAGRPRLDALVLLLALTMAAGFASWRFIEEPFRRRTLPPRRLLAAVAALAALVGVAQVAALATNGAPFRYSERSLAIARGAADARIIDPEAKCFLVQSEPIARYDRARCLATRPGAPAWLLVGDSHAAMLYHGLRTAFPGVELQTAVGHGCDLRLHPGPGDGLCDALARLVFDDYLPAAPVAGVIVTGRSEALHVDDLRELGARLKARGRRLVVIGPAPGYTMPVSRVLAETIDRGDPGLPARLIEPRLRDADAALRVAARDGAFAYVSPLAVLCPSGGACRIADGRGLPLYFDGDHYTPEGSRLAVAALVRAGSFADTGLPVSAR